MELSVLAGLTVLVVDDDDDIRDLYSCAIPHQLEGARVLTAANGLEAIKVAEASKPDVIIMDIAMPLLDGLEATCRIRKIPSIASIPIVALTGSVWDSKNVLAAGCDAYLTKPCFVQDLLQEIEQVFTRRGLRPKAALGKTQEPR
jgi:two-component system cell cycle response regulator DivK